MIGSKYYQDIKDALYPESGVEHGHYGGFLEEMSLIQPGRREPKGKGI